MSHLGTTIAWRSIKADPRESIAAASQTHVALEAVGKRGATTKPMLYQLHLLRAFAVLLVVLDHTCLAISEHRPVAPLCIELAWLAGFLGVAIFFTISGYIMVETTRSQPASGRAALGFFWRRLLRIVPMYYLATAIFVGAGFAGLTASASATNPLAVLCSLLFIPLPNARHLMEPVLSQGWTLNNEMYFYLLFAASLLLPQRARALTLGGVLVGTVGAAAVLGHAGYDLGQAARFLAAPIVLNFAFGLALATFGVPTTRRTSPWLALAGVFVLTGCLFGAAFYTWSQLGGPVGIGGLVNGAVYAVAALSCWLCTRTNAPFPVGGPLGAVARLGTLLGDASYTTYLFHLFVITAVVRCCFYAGAGPILTVFYCVTSAVGVTVALHRAVELPLNAWVRRRLRSRRVKGGQQGVRYVA